MEESPRAESPCDADLARAGECVRRILLFGFKIPEQNVDDLLQDALVDFLVERRRRPDVTVGLLVVIARRRAWRYWHQRGREVSLSDEMIEALLVDGGEQARRLHESLTLVGCWRAMTKRCQEILRQRYYRRGTLAEIASTLRCTSEALKKSVSRCLSRLRTAIRHR